MTRRALIAALAALALPGVAAAHVTVTPRTAVPGEVAALTFRVPSERTGARTVRIEIFFPPGAPVESVRVKPHKGWTTEVHRSTPAGPVAEAGWAAAGPAAGIAYGRSALFALRTGPLPAADRMVFKVLQTYSDGTVVRWIQEPQPGEDAPERPAPTVELSAAPGAPGTAGSDGTAVWIWVAVAGALWAVAGGAVLLLRRRRPG